MEAQELYAQGLESYRDGAVPESALQLEQARTAFLARGDEAQAATVANDLGVVYYMNGEYDKSAQVLQESLAVFQKTGNLVGQAKAIGNRAQLLNRTGKKNEAEKEYERAADLFHQAGERSFEYETYRACSQMQLQRGHLLEALATFDRALAAKGGSRILRAIMQLPLRLAGMRR